MTQNGMMYLSEKGEVYVAICLNEELEARNSAGGVDIQEMMNLVFSKAKVQ